MSTARLISWWRLAFVRGSTRATRACWPLTTSSCISEPRVSTTSTTALKESVTAVLSGWAPMWLVDLVSATSVLSHFASIARGVLDVRDLLYYLSVMVFMIFVNGVILQNRESA